MTLAAAPTPEHISAWLRERVGHYVDQPADAIDPAASFADYGLDSVYAFALCGEIEDTLHVTVEPTLIWDVENLAALTGRIVELVAARTAH